MQMRISGSEFTRIPPPAVNISAKCGDIAQGSGVYGRSVTGGSKMRSGWAVVGLLVLLSALGNAQGTAGGGSTTGRTALTIYNQDFAVIRTPVELNLQAGTTDVAETNVTAQVEPDSVVLRDVTGKRPIHILEQNFDGALRVQSQMLAKFEGKTIDFVIQMSDGTAKIVQGKVI